MFSLSCVSGRQRQDVFKPASNPFPNIRACPAGNISPGNYKAFLTLDYIPCPGGSRIMPENAQAKKLK